MQLQPLRKYHHLKEFDYTNPRAILFTFMNKRLLPVQKCVLTTLKSVCKNEFNNNATTSHMLNSPIARYFNLRFQNKHFSFCVELWLAEMCARCFLPVKKKKYSRALILMKNEIEAFLPFTYNFFSIDSLQFNNHVLKHFLYTS